MWQLPCEEKQQILTVSLLSPLSNLHTACDSFSIMKKNTTNLFLHLPFFLFLFFCTSWQTLYVQSNVNHRGWLNSVGLMFNSAASLALGPIILSYRKRQTTRKRQGERKRERERNIDLKTNKQQWTTMKQWKEQHTQVKVIFICTDEKTAIVITQKYINIQIPKMVTLWGNRHSAPWKQQAGRKMKSSRWADRLDIC